MAILYGVKKVVITEIDPTTEKPKAESPKVATITTADNCECEAVLAEGGEEVLRTDDRILAIVDIDELPYGYNVKLKDNTMSASAISMVTGMSESTATDASVSDEKKLALAMMADGNDAQSLFKLEIYIANYKGSSIVNYAKITFNKCKGKPLNLTVGKEFFAPELEIKAREATKANLPIMEIDFVQGLPS